MAQVTKALESLKQSLVDLGWPDWLASLVLLAGGVFLAAYLGPYLATVLKRGYDKYQERQRRFQLLRLLRAEFGQIARHSATNLRRLTEVFRAPPIVRDLIVAVKKISLEGSHTSADETLFSGAKVADLALMPENLSRDAMRIQLKTRNIEIDIKAVVEELERGVTSDTFDPGTMSAAQRRLESLAQAVERAAQDSAEIIVKLKKYEASLRKSGLIPWIRRWLLFGWTLAVLRAFASWALGWMPLWLYRPARFLGRRISASDIHGPAGFDDQPIHSEDVTSLREVADWQSWKEEQALLATEDIAGVLRTAIGEAAQDHQVKHQLLGTINQIARCDVGGRSLCVRVRVNEAIFQYEKGLIKEAVVARAVERAAGSDGPHDDLMAKIITEVQSGPSDTKIGFGMGPDVHYHSPRFAVTERRSFPLLIADWAPGELLGQVPDNGAFEALGAAIKELQHVRFAGYYRNFRDLGRYRFARSFSADLTKELQARNADLGLVPSQRFERWIEKFRRVLDEEADREQFVLCHNDLHVNNVFVQQGNAGPEVSIVDWDNACVHHRLFDFVKIRYWGTLGADGRFEQNEDYFASFCKGFGVPVDEVLKSPVFKALCALWLFRVYNFEARREARGLPIPAPFLPSSDYKSYIDEVFSFDPIGWVKSKAGLT